MSGWWCGRVNVDYCLLHLLVVLLSRELRPISHYEAIYITFAYLLYACEILFYVVPPRLKNNNNGQVQDAKTITTTTRRSKPCSA